MNRIPSEIVDQVRTATDIVHVVSGYLALRQRGRNYFGLCPFHKEKTPSFSVNPDLQIFHCFGCGAGGNVFTFLMKMEGVTFPEAVKQLARDAGVSLPEEADDFREYREKEALFYVLNMAADYFKQSIREDKGATARDYLEKRGITPEDFETFSIGYAPQGWDNLIKRAAQRSLKTELLEKAGLVVRNKEGRYYDRFRGRITFAIKSLSGQVLGFGARRLSEDNSPKYINSPESEIYQKRYILYGLYMARSEIRQQDEVVIVEGYTDFTSLWKSGVRNVVATSGTALTEDHAVLLRRYTTNAVMLYDSDQAGASAALRGGDILLENGLDVKVCSIPQDMDPDDFVRQSTPDAVKRTISEAVPLLEFKIATLEHKGKHGSATERANATRQILTSVSRVHDPIRRAFLVRDLSERLNIEEVSLWSEIKKLDQQRRVRVRQTDETPETDDYFFRKRGLAELGLLEAVLKDPELIPKIMRNINLEHIRHTEIRAILAGLMQEDIDPLTFQPEQVLARVETPVIAKRLTQVMMQEDSHPRVWEFTRDCIVELQQAIVEEELEDLETKLRSTSGEDMADMKNKLGYLVNERQKIMNGDYITD
ncbi:MAG: DNA primase [candidate division KSB1 bacterium]|nr:DNA primase [candidate division KSB1 bacterium]